MADLRKKMEADIKKERERDVGSNSRLNVKLNDIRV